MSGDSNTSGITSHMPLLLAILIGASIWIYTYTSWFPIFGSILGFGGVLVVVPAMQGLMAPARRQAYAQFVDQLLFQNPRSALAYIVVLCAGLIAGFVCVQPLRLTNHLLNSSLDIRVGFSQHATDKPPTRHIRINAGDTHSTPLLQPFLNGASYVWVSSPGLPQIRKKVAGFGWPKMDLPEDLWRQPIILLRPSASLLVNLDRTLPKLEVQLTRNGGAESATQTCIVQEKYVGEPVWIGGGKDTFKISDSRLRAWAREFRLAKLRGELEGDESSLSADQILTTTLRPRCEDTASAFDHLQIGDSISWRLTSRNANRLISKGQMKIEPNARFPLEVRLDQVEGEDS